ncbi:MAG: rRNA maturation RNase YbeY [Clostridiales Family XIII bacterium]|jgi:probable rRNA maturation factor|nr:rRNA maturation RNase YbeY [Clostridiales Family XIII bacterium]
MNIIFSDEKMPGKTLVDLMTRAGILSITDSGLDPDTVEISVTFVDAEEMRELNHIHMGKNQVTDVLSFPQYSSIEEMPRDGYFSIGDVVVCSEQALLQADEFGHSPERELVYLFVHSIFHLMGYDHDAEETRTEMREAEEKIMSEMGLLR